MDRNIFRAADNPWDGDPWPGEVSAEQSDELFGDGCPPAPDLGLDGAQRAALAAAVDAGLRAHGCDNTLRTARQWAGGAGVAWPALRDRLRLGGGYCDCEILFNVLPEEPEPD